MATCRVRPYCCGWQVGALLAVQFNDTKLPGRWVNQTRKFLDIKQMVHMAVVQARSSDLAQLMCHGLPSFLAVGP